MEIIQNILIILLPMIALVDNRGIAIINHWPVTVGFLAGLIMGDLSSALVIAGTFQLMSLGVAALGGSSVPDYALATVVAIYLKAKTGADIGTAVSVGLPVGILGINLDIFTRTINSFISEKSKQYLFEKKFKKMQAINFISIILVTMQAFIPMVILVVLGPSAVNKVVEVTPKWITNGLNIAGGMLPVVGVAMLMRQMPTKKYLWALLLGFVFSAYLKLPILAISIMGLAFALFTFNDLNKNHKTSLETNSMEDEELFDE